MTRREHAPYTHRHKFGVVILSLLVLGLVGALLVLIGMMTAAKALG